MRSYFSNSRVSRVSREEWPQRAVYPQNLPAPTQQTRTFSKSPSPSFSVLCFKCAQRVCSALGLLGRCGYVWRLAQRPTLPVVTSRRTQRHRRPAYLRDSTPVVSQDRASPAPHARRSPVHSACAGGDQQRSAPVVASIPRGGGANPPSPSLHDRPFSSFCKIGKFATSFPP